MTDKIFGNAIRHIVSEYQEAIGQPVKPEEVYIVWSCKTLQNFKALAGTPIDGDGLYYEFTYNGDADQLYFDVYKKQKNVCIDKAKERFAL